MEIVELFQAPCGNRVRSNATKDMDPSPWLTKALSPKWKVYSFHFFVNWKSWPPTIPNTAFLTRLVEFDQNEDPAAVDTQQILNAFKESKFHVESENLGLVCSKYNKELVTILLPERKTITWDTPYWRISRDNHGELKASKYDLHHLAQSIRTIRGSNEPLGRKGLRLGTSAVECFLSKTDAIYPGDVDAIIVDENRQIRHIIEFKKHTLAEPISQHLAAKYYSRGNDKRKYQSIDALSLDVNRLQDSKATSVIFYYSIRKPHKIRLQNLESLNRYELHITRDTGDITIDSMSEQQIAEQVANWLKAPRS